MNKKREKTFVDSITLERQWKDQIKREHAAVPHWENRWGPVKDRYADYYRQMRIRVGNTLPPLVHVDPSRSMYPTKSHHSSTEYSSKNALLPKDAYYLPLTSSQNYGWQWIPSSDSILDLEEEDIPNSSNVLNESELKEYQEYLRSHTLYSFEKYPRHAQGLQNIHKWWGGAKESL